MTRITRQQFLADMTGKTVPVAQAVTGLDASEAAALRSADRNRDGQVRGDLEMKALFTAADAFDHNGDSGSVDAQTATGAATPAARLLDAARAAALPTSLSRTQFLSALAGKTVDLSVLAADARVPASMKAAMADVDTNQLVSGDGELALLFSRLDTRDHDGNSQSVALLDSAGQPTEAAAIYQAILDATRQAPPRSPLMTRVAFELEMRGKGVPVAALAADARVPAAMAARLNAVDADHNGRIAGVESRALFAELDRLDSNGDAGSVDLQDAQGAPTAAAGALDAIRDARVDEPVVIVNQRSRATTAAGTPVYRVPGKDGFFFTSGLTVDADGSPHAYHPVSRRGLDALANAGHDGNWWGVVTDSSGDPVVQGNTDPAPGYYVSTTTLEDPHYPRTDPRRYVDSETIPFFVLPRTMSLDGVQPGDFAAVVNNRTGAVAYAIFADKGPANHIGEGSIALANALGINADPRGGGTGSGVSYVVFPGSGNGQARSATDIASEGARLFTAWGGVAQLQAVTA